MSTLSPQGQCGRLLLKRAVSNEGSMTLIVSGKWKGKVTVPVSCTVGDLKTHVAAASKIDAASQKIIFKGKKLEDDSAELKGLKIKNKSRLFLRCTAVKPVKPMTAASSDALAMKEKLSAQGAGNINAETAESYIRLVKDEGPPSEKSVVIRAVQLFYKSNGQLANARNIARVEKAEASMREASNATMGARDAGGKEETGDDAEDESSSTEKKKKKKKKKLTHKEMIREIKMARQSSEERRKAHKEFLSKNLGGGKFDKLDKI